jgi:branched-chain amino acid transport system permease protein
MIDFGPYLQLTASALVIGAIYALIGVALNLIYGVTHFLNIAHGDVLMVGAYVATLSFTYFRVSPLISLFLAAGICGLMGLVAYALPLRRILSTAKSIEMIESRSLLIFFGLILILDNTVALFWTSDTRAYSYLNEILTFPGLTLQANRLFMMLFSMGAVIVIYIMILRTWFGRGVRFVSEDVVAARMVGVNVGRIEASSVVLSFALIGMAGVLVSMIYNVTPDMGLPYTMAAFIVIILGGFGNIRGSVLAGLLLGFVETYGMFFTSPSLRIVIMYSMFIALVIILPVIRKRR